MLFTYALRRNQVKSLMTSAKVIFEDYTGLSEGLHIFVIQ